MSCLCCSTEQIEDGISSARVAGFAAMILKQMQHVSAAFRSSLPASTDDNGHRMEEVTGLILRAMLCGLRVQGKAAGNNTPASQQDELGGQGLVSLLKGLPLAPIQLSSQGTHAPLALLLKLTQMLGEHSTVVQRWQWILTVLLVNGALSSLLAQLGVNKPGSDGQAVPMRLTPITRAILRAYTPGSILVTASDATRLAMYVAEVEAACKGTQVPRGYLKWVPKSAWCPSPGPSPAAMEDISVDLLVLRVLAPVLAVCRPGAVEPHALEAIYKSASVDIPALPSGTLPICWSYLGYDGVAHLVLAANQVGIQEQEALAGLRFLLQEPFCRRRLQHMVLRVHGSPSSVSAWTTLDHQLLHGCVVPVPVDHGEHSQAGTKHQAQASVARQDCAALGEATPYNVGAALLSALRAASRIAARKPATPATVIVNNAVVQTEATQRVNVLRHDTAVKKSSEVARACTYLLAVDDRLRCPSTAPPDGREELVQSLVDKVAASMLEIQDLTQVIQQVYDVNSEADVSVSLRVWEASQDLLESTPWTRSQHKQEAESRDHGGLVLRQADDGHEWHARAPVEASEVHVSESGGLSRILTPSLMLHLRDTLPKSEQSCAWHRAYSMTRDGASLTGLMSKVQAEQASGLCSSKYSILVIKDSHGAVFGCCTACPWATLGQGAGRALKAVHDTFVFTAEDRGKEAAVRSHIAADRQVQGKLAELATHAVHIGWTGPTPSVRAQAEEGVHHTDKITIHTYPLDASSPSGTPLFLSVDKNSNPTRLDVGLGGTARTSAALSLHDRMEQGESGPCEPFLSPPLCSLESKVVSGSPSVPVSPGSPPTLAHLGPVLHYSVMDVEVWTFVRRDLRTDIAVQIAS